MAITTPITVLAFEAWKKDWPDNALIQVFKNTNFKELGEWLWEEQSKYTGPNHKELCALISGHVFKQLIDCFNLVEEF